MKHRIVVLGAGYAGAFAAGSLARRLSPADTEITVVNADPDFVERLDALGEGAAVLVVGEGLTGIETATELAESRPGLSVALAARGELGARLAPKARRHLCQAFDRLGITVHEHTAIEAVEPTRAIVDRVTGASVPADVTVWSAGFAVHPIAAASGLEVAATGRIVVDATMRSVSHPDVYAAGDCAYAIGANGLPLPMSCASAGLTTMRATAAIVARLTGGEVPRAELKYHGNHISLGRRDAIFQMVDGDARSKSWYLGGRTASRLKSAVLKGAGWGIDHPTFGVPKRRRRLAAAADGPAVPAAA
ncbi:FAD-dependent oxidoreductase [Streptomyces sp. NPDC002138]|uniref:NAD(P)/FAD-dependent oxidoreductase n=1 Tax=Streptomyces sp. NPDC002138 TaxID=3154410 RepID=UPI00332444A8